MASEADWITLEEAAHSTAAEVVVKGASRCRSPIREVTRVSAGTMVLPGGTEA